MEGADRRLARARQPRLSAAHAPTIMPQLAVERLFALTRDRDPIITTEVGQHQMWAAQYFHFYRARTTG